MRRPILGIAFSFAAAAQTFPVAGVVMDGVRGLPLERARVVLASAHLARRAITTADGKFSFEMPEGKYTLLAERNGWGTVYGLPAPSVGFGSAVIVGPGQDTAHLVLRWYAPGAVTGRITDESGEPVRNARVQLIRVPPGSGGQRVVNAGFASTDDRGEYRFGTLPTGTYYVAVMSSPWYASHGAVGRIEGSVERQETPVGFAPVYYPGSSDLRSATPIKLKSGAEVQADIVLRTSAAVHVRFLCPGSGAENDKCPGYIVLHPEGVEGIWDVPSEAVPPGRYSLRLRNSDKTVDQVIDVGSSDMTVELTLETRPAVTGKVAFKPADPVPAGLAVNLVSETNGSGFGAPIEADGTFRFPGLEAGRYRLGLSGNGGWFIANESAEGAALRDGVLEIKLGAAVNVSVAASNETGRLKGFAMAGETPAPAVMVVLVPLDGRSQPVGFQTESDGSFDYEAIPVGDYLLYAVDKLDFEFANPEVARPFLAGATAVHVPAHGVVEQRVPVTTIEPELCAPAACGMRAEA